MDTSHLNSRGKMIHESNRLSDCTFHFPKSGRTIEANKSILALASPVMETMFFSNPTYTEASTAAVEILDVDDDAFEKFVLWIYAKELVLGSVPEGIAVFLVANKYEVIDLEIICSRYIESNTSLENVCLAWKFSQLFNCTKVESKSMAVIRRQTTEVLTSSEFRQLANVDLWMVLWEALQKFATINSLERSQLDAAVKCIRFKVIDPYSLIKFDCALLTEAEKLAIVEHNKSEDDAMDYPDGFSICTAQRCTDYVKLSESIQRFLKDAKKLHYTGVRQFYLSPAFQLQRVRIADIVFLNIDQPTSQQISSALQDHLPRENGEDNISYLSRIFEDDNPRVIVPLVANMKVLRFQ